MPCQDCSPIPCNDFPLVSTVTTVPDCNECEKCEDVLDSLCSRYSGPNLSVLGITNNTRLKHILITLNKSLGALPGTSNYVASVSLNNKATLEYLDASGDLVVVTLSSTNSPLTITALTGSPVMTSGVGTITLV